MLNKYSDYIDENPKKINKFFSISENKIMSFDKVKNKNIKKNIFFISCNMVLKRK